MKTKLIRSISVLLSVIIYSQIGFSLDWKQGYPEHWWAPVDKASAPSWEVLPQEAGYKEVILSKRHELGILSNFANTPFDYKGVRYQSVEGFWQMMKFPEDANDARAKIANLVWPHTRDEVAQMLGSDAKKAGSFANKVMKDHKIDWVTFEKKQFPYKTLILGEHYKLIYEVMIAKLEQNPEVKRILLSTGDLTLRPDHVVEKDLPKEWHYYQIWMEVRENLKSQTTKK